MHITAQLWSSFLEHKRGSAIVTHMVYAASQSICGLPQLIRSPLLSKHIGLCDFLMLGQTVDCAMVIWHPYAFIFLVFEKGRLMSQS